MNEQGEKNLPYPIKIRFAPNYPPQKLNFISYHLKYFQDATEIAKLETVEWKILVTEIRFSHYQNNTPSFYTKNRLEERNFHQKSLNIERNGVWFGLFEVKNVIFLTRYE